MTLCETFGISRVSVRRALQMLEQEGLVNRRHGVGTFVESVENGSDSTVRLGGLIDNLITLGLETTAELISFDGDTRLPPFAASSLKLGPDDRGVRIERLRLYRGRPLSLTEVYLPPYLSPLIRAADIDDRPIIRILEGAGLKAVSAEQTISAVVADDYVALKLQVAIGSPLLRLRKTVFNQSGAPFEYQQGLYSPDQYEYYMLLTRDTNSNRPQWRHIG
jgi:GntR family transcriptional regulator